MKSTGGYLLYYNGQIFDLRTSKIICICTSTIAAEFMALYYEVTNCIYFGHLLQEVFNINVFPITVYGDNKSANDVALGKAQGGITKYIAAKYRMLQQMAEEGFIRIHYVSTKCNLLME